jgi:cytochrome c1
MKALKHFFLGLALSIPLALASNAALANEAGYPLDHFPEQKLTDNAALQNGAKIFVNYCLNCHAAASMRYNRLTDLGLTEDQIKKNLLFTGNKVGDPMTTSLRAADAKEWFGALPPDLSVIARARASGAGSGPDWLYTYLRAYYRDGSRSTGWNNAQCVVAIARLTWCRADRCQRSKRRERGQKQIYAHHRQLHDRWHSYRENRGDQRRSSPR